LERGEETDLIEIPASWYLDDLPPMMFIKAAPNSHGFVNPRDIEQLWLDQFDWVYREYDYAVFAMTIHPDVSGRPQVLLMHEPVERLHRELDVLLAGVLLPGVREAAQTLHEQHHGGDARPRGLDRVVSGPARHAVRRAGDLANGLLAEIDELGMEVGRGELQDRLPLGCDPLFRRDRLGRGASLGVHLGE